MYQWASFIRTNQLSEYFCDSTGTQVFDNGGPTFMHAQFLSCFGIGTVSHFFVIAQHSTSLVI